MRSSSKSMVWATPFILLSLSILTTELQAGSPICLTDADCTDPSLPTCNMDTGQCEAESSGCFSDADCPNPSEPICNLVTNMCEASPMASLSGTVADRADGSTPVHPVTVRLLHHSTGADLGITAATNSAGEYTFNSLTVDDYKVLFDANGAASAYVDELYDGVACDNAACDTANLGTAVSLSAGANVLDYDLSVGYTISGDVLNDQAEFLENAVLEIFNGDGTFLATAITDAVGHWSRSRIRIDDYYVRINPFSVSGYTAEIFDDIPCFQCDAQSTGDVITVSGDTININFVLDPVPDHVFESGFEDTPP